MKTYRCKHAVEAMCWMDTDEKREAFAAWFEEHDAVFETRGPEVVLPTTNDLPEDAVVVEGEWILYSDGEFMVMHDGMFTDTYEEIP